MKLTVNTIVRRMSAASRTEAGGLTIIGIGMLISTNLAEALEHPVLREVAQIAVVLAGAFGTVLLFASERSDKRPD